MQSAGVAGLGGEADHGEDDQVCGVAHLSGSWRNRIQWVTVVVVQHGCVSLTCWLTVQSFPALTLLTFYYKEFLEPCLHLHGICEAGHFLLLTVAEAGEEIPLSFSRTIEISAHKEATNTKEHLEHGFYVGCCPHRGCISYILNIRYLHHNS